MCWNIINLHFMDRNISYSKMNKEISENKRWNLFLIEFNHSFLILNVIINQAIFYDYDNLITFLFCE